MLKKTLFVVAGLFVLVILGLVVFVLTFDANRYKGRLEKEASKALGRPVTVGHLSLQIKNGVALKVEKIKADPGLEAAAISAVLRLKPLLEKRIEIESVIIDGFSAELAKLPDGQMGLGGVALPVSGQKTSSASAQSANNPEKAVDLRIDSIEIFNGRFRYLDPSFGRPLDIDGIYLKAGIHPQKLEIRELTFSAFGGELKAKGEVNDYTATPAVSAHLTAIDLSIKVLSETFTRETPKLEGKVSADADLRFQGKEWPAISQSLNADAKLGLKDGVIINVNILREIISKLSAIPGAEDVINQNFPAQYRASLERPHTFLGPIQLEGKVRDGKVALAPFNIPSDFVALGARGEVGLDRSVNIDAAIYVAQAFSAAVVQATPVTRVALNGRGEFEVPAHIGGTFSKLEITPDTRAIAERVAANAAQDLISNLLTDPKGSVNKWKKLIS